MRDKLSLFFLAQPPQARASVSGDMWRSLFYFNLYRLFLAALLLGLAGAFGDTLQLGERDRTLFVKLAIAYLMLVLAALPATRLRNPPFNIQLAFQVGSDILMLTLLSHVSGGVQGNLGMLLLVSLAAAGLVCRGRITLFFAALASIAVLLEHGYSVLKYEVPISSFMQAGLLSAAFFAVAWLTHTLSRYAVASEKLAALRGVDLSNLAEANRLVIQDMPDGVLLVDERSMVRQYNPGAERLLGNVFGGGETPISLADCSPVLDALYAAWRQSHTNRLDVLHFPATDAALRVRFLPVQRESFWGAVVVLEDMQRVQAQAQQAKLAALGRLTANIAHEVRNPLSSISYAAELLREDLNDPAHARLFQIILDNADRLNNIVLDVLQLNRRDRVSTESLNLNERLPLFVDSLQQTEAVQPGTIHLDLMEGSVVQFDRGHFEQVLWNLSRNALRYCLKQPGSVELRTWRNDEDALALDVVNDGPAVGAEAEQKLFEPFFTTSVGGTGLGLYIARELCAANGAALEYRALADGRVCFRIVFGGKHES
ncbi:MAG TPA: histidine kinase dimerization/phospho-acceptor domain-containing protein [Gallionellaceae bacterium]|nr:histidine kinase dimerization/phospho-acceptor domain-containing protein [Gallionellaceae bacterium]